MRTGEAKKPNGSEVSYLSSFLTVNELSYAFQIPADELMAKLRNQNLAANLHDRFPFMVVANALLAEGWTPTPLSRLR